MRREEIEIYQYETSPRKLEQEYNVPKKKSKKKAVSKISKTSQEKIKAKESRTAKINFSILLAVALGCILLIMYRNVQINESFSEVQSLSKEVSTLEKENSQISVNIQNSLNLSNIESIASTTLGMQKLSNKQTVYITLDTKDYVEVSTGQIETETEENFFKSLWEKFLDLF